MANQFQNAVPDYVLKNFKAASQKAAMLYVNAGAAVENGKLQAQAMTLRGMKFVYEQAIEVSDFNYAPYVQQLKDRDVGYVQFIGAASQAVKLAQAMEQQNYEPDIYMLDPTAYTSEFLSGGSAIEGATIFTNFVPFEESRLQPGDPALHLVAAAGEARRRADLLRCLRLVRRTALRAGVHRPGRSAQPGRARRVAQQGAATGRPTGCTPSSRSAPARPVSAGAS